MTLPHRLDRIILIQAPQDLVFRYFTDSSRWAAWWGAGSTIDPRPGGRAFIRYPNGAEASGRVLEIEPPDRIVFTTGFESGTPIPPDSSRVTIRLERATGGTRLHLAHEFAEPGVRDEHVQGWRYQLSLFANVVANELHAGAEAAVDAWFDVWADPDAASRGRTLTRIASPEVRFRDRWSVLDGIADLEPHIAAAQRFMPGIRLTRQGAVRHCQGTVLADWTAAGADGQPRGRGTNVFTFGTDARIEAVTGVWDS